MVSIGLPQIKKKKNEEEEEELIAQHHLSDEIQLKIVLKIIN